MSKKEIDEYINNIIYAMNVTNSIAKLQMLKRRSLSKVYNLFLDDYIDSTTLGEYQSKINSTYSNSMHKLAIFSDIINKVDAVRS